MIPNGGFYHVVEMTFENYQQLIALSSRPGYTVDYVEGPLGFFDKDGFQVDPGSIERNDNKMVTNYTKLTRKRAGKETPIKATHKDTERAETFAEAQMYGMNIPVWNSTQQAKEKIELAKRGPQETLAVG